jgi:hypothetical protein
MQVRYQAALRPDVSKSIVLLLFRFFSLQPIASRLTTMKPGTVRPWNRVPDCYSETAVSLAEERAKRDDAKKLVQQGLLLLNILHQYLHRACVMMTRVNGTRQESSVAVT